MKRKIAIIAPQKKPEISQKLIPDVQNTISQVQTRWRKLLKRIHSGRQSGWPRDKLRVKINSSKGF
jgi:hypothetical protein